MWCVYKGKLIREEIEKVWLFLRDECKSKKAEPTPPIEHMDLVQETISRFIKKVKNDELEQVGECFLSKQTSFNSAVKNYLKRTYMNVFHDLHRNNTFRRKTEKEKEKGISKSVQLTLISNTDDKSNESQDIYTTLPTLEESPEKAARILQCAKKFISILELLLDEELNVQKKKLLRNFFSLSYRTSHIEQRVLAEQCGFTASVAAKYIERFKKKLTARIKEEHLPLEVKLGTDSRKFLEIFFTDEIQVGETK